MTHTARLSSAMPVLTFLPATVSPGARATLGAFFGSDPVREADSLKPTEALRCS